MAAQKNLQATLSAALKNADCYLPLVKKEALAELLAGGCIEQVEITSALNGEALPPLWQETGCGKSIVLLYVLAGYYLHLVDVSPLEKAVPEFQFSLEDYDNLASLPWELEDLCGQGAKESKYADAILRDFADFRTHLESAIHRKLQIKNDLLARFSLLLFSQASPSGFQEMIKDLEQVREDLATASARAQGTEEKP